jgi:hypothetical protein
MCCGSRIYIKAISQAANAESSASSSQPQRDSDNREMCQPIQREGPFGLELAHTQAGKSATKYLIMQL